MLIIIFQCTKLQTHILLAATAAATLNNGKTYIIKRNSLCGKKEYKNTNKTAGIKTLRTRESKMNPKGTRNIEAAIPRGMAE